MCLLTPQNYRDYLLDPSYRSRSAQIELLGHEEMLTSILKQEGVQPDGGCRLGQF